MSPKAPPVRDLLLALVAPEHLFHDQSPRGRVGYALIRFPEHDELYPVRSTAFREILRDRFMSAYPGTGVGAQAMQDAIDSLDALACRGAAFPVGLRVQNHEGAIYIDLADDRWRQVRVGADGWSVTAAGRVFRRAPGMLPLPEPAAGADLDELREFLRLSTDSDWWLVAGWLVAAVRPTGPYPVLILQGEHGTAKSTTARVLRALVDPSAAALTHAPKDESAFMTQADCQHVLVFDNLQTVNDRLRTMLCTMSTGAGLIARKLYTDGEPFLFQAMRPQIITGINELTTGDDLTDRALVVTLDPIPDNARIREDEFWAKFERARPALFGALLDAVALALREAPRLELRGLPRMADFAQFAAAAAPAYGATAEGFLEAYRRNRREAMSAGLEGSPVGTAVRLLIDARGAWSGTVGELFEQLNHAADDAARQAHGWPNSPRGLGNHLRALAPALRAVGVDVRYTGTTRAGRTIAIGRCGATDEPAATVERLLFAPPAP